MGKKSAQKSAPKTSSAASLAASGRTLTGNKSSILRASFAPSGYQLALFASVIQGLDGQHLRIHDTNTDRLQCEHILSQKEVVTSLDWGYYAGRQKEQTKKKRKRHSDTNGAADALDQGDVVVAFGTSTSDVRMYSPIEDKIVGTLTGGHERGVKDFKFTANTSGQEGWSIGGDNKLVQWDLRAGQRTRIIDLPATSAFTTISRPVTSNPPVICASHRPYVVGTDGVMPITFPDMPDIQTIITSSTKSVSAGLFLASDNGRFINVYNPQDGRLVMNLVTEREVSSMSLYRGQEVEDDLALERQVLAVVTQDGTIELFTRPFIKAGDSKGTKSLKAKSAQMINRAKTSIKITKSSTSKEIVPVVSVAFQGPELVVAWTHGGIIPLFERIRWLDEETQELAFTGVETITKTKSSSILQSVTTNGTRNANESHVNESRIVVEQGNMVEDDVEMEDSKQDAISVEDSDEDSEADDEPKQTKESQNNAEVDSDVEMDNAAESGAEDGDEDEEEEGMGEPTFGELMRVHASEAIDVEAELEDDVHTRSLIPGKPITTVQQIPNGVSLGTVLTQSLKTNDNDMLESCFHVGDRETIRTTIQRLDSPLAATLLQRLAERLAARPGRYGHLLVWVQWTCIAHGGALAGKSDLLKQMSSLFKVMDQRSSTLPSLLLLKGKLDMLDAQLGLRQSIRDGAEDMESDDEENVIYVEGHEDDEENSDEETTKIIETPRTRAIRDQPDESMMDDSGNEEGSEDDEDEEEEEEEEEDENILDVEAEESAGSSDAEESDEDESEDDADADSVGSIADFIADTEDESDGESLTQPPPSKKVKLNRGGGGGGGKEKNKAGSGRK